MHTGPRFGGLLNATLGNATELIITLFAIRAGLLDLVYVILANAAELIITLFAIRAGLLDLVYVILAMAFLFLPV